MDRPALYPVCPYRNVPAAFERFHGRDAGGVGRFFVDQPGRDPFATLLQALPRADRAVAAWRLRLAHLWGHWGTHPQLSLLPGAQPVASFPV
jgi:hypothetical protein